MKKSWISLLGLFLVAELAGCYPVYASLGGKNHRRGNLGTESQNEVTSSRFLSFISPVTQMKTKFFYSITSEGKIDFKGKPLIFWTNGGPGQSSLSVWFKGMSKHFLEKNDSVSHNEHAWSKFANVVTVDQPVGTGFSFLQDNDRLRKNFDEVSQDYLAFLKGFFEHYGILSDEKPTLIVMAGESINGHFLPQTTNMLHDYLLSVGSNLSRTLKSVLVSPFVYPSIHYESFKPYALEMGLISPERAQDPHLLELENACLENLRVDYVDEKVTEVCFDYVDYLVDFKFTAYDVRKKSANPLEKKKVLYINWKKTEDAITQGDYEDRLGLDTVRQELGSLSSKFKFYNVEINKSLRVDCQRNKVDHVEGLINDAFSGMKPGREIPLLVITGKQDMMSNFIGARNWIETLEMVKSAKRDYKQLVLSKSVSIEAGSGSIQYTKSGRLYQAEIENAGHMIGNTNPGVLASLMESFIKGDL